MSEHPDERIKRLTLLAQKVWPDRDAEVCIATGDDEHDACVVLDGEADWTQMLGITHPRALDALEAALCVLASKPPRWATELAEEWLAEAKRIPKYEKYDQSIPHVRAAVLTGERCYRSLALQLLEAAKGGAQ